MSEFMCLGMMGLGCCWCCLQLWIPRWERHDKMLQMLINQEPRRRELYKILLEQQQYGDRELYLLTQDAEDVKTLKRIQMTVKRNF